MSRPRKTLCRVVGGRLPIPARCFELRALNQFSEIAAVTEPDEGPRFFFQPTGSFSPEVVTLALHELAGVRIKSRSEDGALLQ